IRDDELLRVRRDEWSATIPTLGCVGAEFSSAVPRTVNNYGKACTVVLKRKGSWKSVLSPAFFPGTGCSLAERGLFHFVASEATSPKRRSICSGLMSPGSGIVSNPVPQTAEYASSESML